MIRCIWCDNLTPDDLPVCEDCQREIDIPFVIPNGQNVFEALAHALRRQLETKHGLVQ